MHFTINFGYKPRNPIFENLEIELPDNKITVLCGHNGAGKTTLLKIISGVLPSNLSESSGWFVPASGGLMKHFSLNDHIKILGTERSSLFTEAFDSLGAAEFCKKPVRNLSTGQTAIAAILTAIASNEGFLLIDEPFAALDPINAENLIGILKKTGKTTLITSHNLFLTGETADYIIFLRNGKISWSNENKNLSVENLTTYYKEFA